MLTRFRRALIGSMMTWLVVPIASHAQSGDLQALRSEVERLYRDGKYAESRTVARLYVVRAKQQHGPNHTEYATAISWLASSLQAEVRCRQAELHYTRSLAIRQKGLGSDHTDVGQWRWRKG